MSLVSRESLSWKLAAIGGVLVVLMGVAVAAILYRSQDLVQEQTIFTLDIELSPNPLPPVGLGNDGRGTFTFELTVSNSFQNPNLTLTVFVQPSFASLNLSIGHCLENSQPNLSFLNTECPNFQGGPGQYFANVTSGSSVTLRIQALYIGSFSEPTSVKWLFWAEGEEIP